MKRDPALVVTNGSRQKPVNPFSDARLRSKTPPTQGGSRCGAIDNLIAHVDRAGRGRGGVLRGSLQQHAMELQDNWRR